MRGTRRVWVLAAALVGVVLAGCSSDNGQSEIERAAAQIAAAASSTSAPPFGTSGSGGLAVARAAMTSSVARPVRAMPFTFWKAVTA